MQASISYHGELLLPRDEAWVDPRVDPRAVFEVLRRLPTTPPFITISRSVGSGFTPLRYRFFADYLAALWEGRECDSDHYDRLYRLERRLRAGEREVVLADCRRERERHPECAATWYLLSLAEQDLGQPRGVRPRLLRSPQPTGRTCFDRLARFAAAGSPWILPR